MCLLCFNKDDASGGILSKYSIFKKFKSKFSGNKTKEENEKKVEDEKIEKPPLTQRFKQGFNKILRREPEKPEPEPVTEIFMENLGESKTSNVGNVDPPVPGPKPIIKKTVII